MIVCAGSAWLAQRHVEVRAANPRLAIKFWVERYLGSWRVTRDDRLVTFFAERIEAIEAAERYAEAVRLGGARHSACQIKPCAEVGALTSICSANSNVNKLPPAANAARGEDGKPVGGSL